MEVKILYQTLDDKSNSDFIKNNAPFPCCWENTWLGKGYYFWDTFIENAHWWGKVRYKNRYVICKYFCDFDNNVCFDLVGNTSHLKDLGDCVELIAKEKICKNKPTVSRILAFLQETGQFKYQAIRAYGINSISESKDKYKDCIYRLKFESSKFQYLDYKPPIQICILKKDGMNLRDLKIEFPEEYCTDYVV